MMRYWWVGMSSREDLKLWCLEGETCNYKITCVHMCTYIYIFIFDFATPGKPRSKSMLRLKQPVLQRTSQSASR